MFWRRWLQSFLCAVSYYRNPIIEDYTQVIYIIGKGDIPSMSLTGPKSMRKVDGLSLIFINFYVSTLTLRFNNTETSLQLPGIMTLVAVCRIYKCVIK
jgi:hypothetical protein